MANCKGVEAVSNLGAIVTCAAADEVGLLKSWRSNNRITLYPRRVNRWILIRTGADQRVSEDIEREAKEVLLAWFGDTLPGSEIPRGRIADPETHGVFSGILNIPKPLEWEGGPITSVADLPSPPNLRDDDSSFDHSARDWAVTVSFAYYGSATSAPWPVSSILHDTPFYSLPPWFEFECPYGAVWTVGAVFPPGHAVNIPDDYNRGFWIPGMGAYLDPVTVIGERASVLVERAKEKVEKVGRRAGNVLVAGGVIAGVLAAIYAASKIRR